MKKKEVDLIEIKILDDVDDESGIDVANVLKANKYRTSAVHATLGIKQETTTRYRLAFESIISPGSQVVGKKDCLELAELFTALAKNLKS